MQFAIDLPPFGPFSDPNLVAQLPQESWFWSHPMARLGR